jgi:hypothetical protein
MKNSREVRYISSEEVVNDVKNRMSGYFNSGKVDESILPRVIRRCVGLMGIKAKPRKKSVLTIQQYKAELPEDFDSVVLVMGCGTATAWVKDEWPNPARISIETAGKCEVCTDQCGNVLKVTYQDQFQKYQYEDYVVLRAASLSYCATNCPNTRSKCRYQFEIKEENGCKVLITDIPEGHLYMEYVATVEHEAHFDIPAHEYIRDWVFEECRKEVYAYLWDNGEDVRTRLDDSKEELRIKHANAMQVYKQREVWELYSMADALARKYHSFERWVSPDTWRYTPYC